MNKYILTAALCISLIGPVNAEPANDHDCSQCASVSCGNCEDAVGVVEEQFTIVEGTELPENDGVEMSAIAKKMTQAEKAQNAAENDSWGGAITIIAMVIVISALAVLSILFFFFGKISESLLSKKKRIASEKNSNIKNDDIDHSLDSGEAIAAISMALSEHFGDGHDMEETILTIRRLNRAYSPWNSKIYNLRQIPELRQNPTRRSAF